MKNSRAYKLSLTAMMAALITVSTFIRIPTPICPITLQAEAVIIAGILSGKKIGSYSALIYLIIGLIGIPVFSGGGGIHYVLVPTFGYILGFAAGAFISGSIADTPLSLPRALIASYAALIAIYAIGTGYFYLITQFVINTPMSIKAILIACVATPLIFDLPLTAFAAITAYKIKPLLD